MPIYEYRCEKCGDFEQMQRITEPALERCPTCRRKVSRLISNTSFQLKGSGWYVTDYARSGSGGEGKKAGDKKSEAASDAGGKSESASKSESSGKSDSGAKPAASSTTSEKSAS